MQAGVDRFDLTGKSALVTGASRGLGRAMALALAEAGADIAVNSRKQEEAESAATEIRNRTGRRAIALAANLGDAQEARTLVERAEAELGRLDVLVNNAGLGIARPALKLGEKEWELVMRVNLRGALITAQAAAPGMIERGYGRIINVGSVLSAAGTPGLAGYVAAKHGLLGLTRTLALEWAQQGVTVNCLCPGFFDTAMTEWIRSDEASFGKVLAMTPMGRMGRPEELAAAAVFLASPASSFVTGCTLFVDGGYTAA